MAFKAVLSIAGTDYKILNCSYSFTQNTGTDRRPISDIRGGLINVSVMSSDDTKLVEWMFDPNKTQDGDITFYHFDDDKVLKKLKFSKAFCVGHTESFDENGMMIESIVISAEKITIGNAQHENHWPDS